MSDYLNAIAEKLHLPPALKALVDHNRYLFVAVIGIGLLFAFAGCQGVTTVSPISGRHVTRDQLDAEAAVAVSDIKTKQDALGAEAKQLKDKLGPAYSDLERKQGAVDMALSAVSQSINTYVPAPFQGLAATGLTALTLALGLDNRRKDAVISGARPQPPQ